MITIEQAENYVKTTSERLNLLKGKQYHKEDKGTSHYAIYLAAENEYKCAVTRLNNLKLK